MKACDLVQDAFDKEEILGKLMSWQSPGELSPKIAKIAAARDIPQDRVCHYIQDLYKLSLPVEEQHMQSFCARMGKLIKQVCLYSDLVSLALGCVGAISCCTVCQSAYFCWLCCCFC
jgi:hypothetical protein